MGSQVTQARAALAAVADPSRAPFMEAYLRHQFPFLGVSSPRLRAAAKPLFEDWKDLEGREVEALTEALWAQPEREFHHLAMEFLWKQRKKWNKETLSLLQRLILSKSWWDTVDFLAPTLVAHWLGRFGDPERVVDRWNRDENLWLIRSSILIQLKAREKTDFERLKSLILPHITHRDFFVRKAIGWALRQYSYSNPEGVRAFVEATSLHPLSRREALKAMERKSQKD